MTPDQAVAAIGRAFADGRRARAFDIVRTLVRQKPPLGEAWGQVADYADRLGDRGAAVAAQQAFIQSNPSDENRRFKMTRLLSSFGSHDEALALADAFIRRHPNSSAVLFRVATLHAQAGDRSRAIALYRQLVDQDPAQGEAWAQLIGLLRRDELDEAELETIQRQIAGKSARSEDDDVALRFAMGDALHARGEHDAAFDWYDQGAQMAYKPGAYSTGPWDAFAERSMELFNEAFFQSAEGAGDETRNCLIIGSARAGTTLTQQLLVAHSDVGAGGELAAAKLSCLPLGHFQSDAMAAFQARARQAGQSPWLVVGKAYARLVDEQFPGSALVVDKAINLPLYIGPLLAGLPNANFIWIRRDPRDVAMSIFRKRFLNDQNWSWRLEDIAHRLAMLDRLRAHFCALFPDRILPVVYEDLAREPGEVTKLLLAHCGLDYQPVHETFYEADNAIMTASLDSARQPISEASVGSWRRYEERMTPFLEAYERFGGVV